VLADALSLVDDSENGESGCSGGHERLDRLQLRTRGVLAVTGQSRPRVQGVDDEDAQSLRLAVVQRRSDDRWPVAERCVAHQEMDVADAKRLQTRLRLDPAECVPPPGRQRQCVSVVAGAAYCRWFDVELRI
jgi:hypothetical protein